MSETKTKIILKISGNPCIKYKLCYQAIQMLANLMLSFNQNF